MEHKHVTVDVETHKKIREMADLHVSVKGTAMVRALIDRLHVWVDGDPYKLLELLGKEKIEI